MARLANYNGLIKVSGDGGATYHEVYGITSAEESFEISTVDETCWDDRGFKNEVPDTVSGTISLEAWYDRTTEGHKVIEQAGLNKAKIRVQYWKNYKESGKYHQFNAYVSSISFSQEVEGKIPLSAEFTIEGVSLQTFYA